MAIYWGCQLSVALTLLYKSLIFSGCSCLINLAQILGQEQNMCRLPVKKEKRKKVTTILCLNFSCSEYLTFGKTMHLLQQLSLQPLYHRPGCSVERGSYWRKSEIIPCQRGEKKGPENTQHPGDIPLRAPGVQRIFSAALSLGNGCQPRPGNAKMVAEELKHCQQRSARKNAWEKSVVRNSSAFFNSIEVDCGTSTYSKEKAQRGCKGWRGHVSQKDGRALNPAPI